MKHIYRLQCKITEYPYAEDLEKKLNDFSMNHEVLSVDIKVIPFDQSGIPMENRYVLGDHVFIIRTNKINSLFLHYLINSKSYNSAIKLNVTGSAQLGLRGVYVENSIINHPKKYDEQALISAALQKIDSLITLHQRK